MKRNLLLFAVSLMLVIGFSTSASATNHPASWRDVTDTDDHTWGGDQGWGSGGPIETIETYGPVTGIFTLDVLIIRLICVQTFDDKDHGILKAQSESDNQGRTTGDWHQEQPISFKRGE